MLLSSWLSLEFPFSHRLRGFRCAGCLRDPHRAYTNSIMIAPLSDIHLDVNMEHIDTLPNESRVLSPTIIPPYGMFCPSARKDEKYNFCMEKITRGQFLIMKSSCNGYFAHTESFKKWGPAAHSGLHSTFWVVFDLSMLLCLQEKTNDEHLISTNCCHTLIHSHCAIELPLLLSSLTLEYSCGCGRLMDCNCLWFEV